MGLLDSIDLDELAKKVLASYQAKDDKAPLSQGLLSAGLGILAANNGRSNGWQAIGQGGMQGLQAYQQGRQAQQKDPAQLIATLSGISGLQQQAQNQQAMREFQGATTGQPVPQQPTYGMQDRSAGEMPPPSVQPNVTREAMMKYLMSPSPQVQAMAKNWLDLNDKGARKLKDTKTLTDSNGQRITVNIFDDGTTQVVPFTPDKEKPHFVDMGDKSAAVDPYTLQPLATFGKSATPGERMADTRSREEMAQRAEQFNRSQGQAERHFQANFNAPQVMDTGDGIVLVDKRNGGSRPVTDESGNPLVKEKPLTEMQAKAVMFGSRMQAASQVLDTLESKSGFRPTSPLNQLAGMPGANYLASKDAQEYSQAKRNWSEAELRYKTGAAVTESEIADNVKIYFPQPGDSAEVVAQKAGARKQAEVAMRSAMGRSGEKQVNVPSLEAVMAEIERRKRGR